MKQNKNVGVKGGEIVAVEKEMVPVVERAKSLAIKSSGDMQAAVAMLSLANKYMDRIKAEEETITGPANAIIKVARERRKPAKDILKVVIETLREKIGDYQTAEKARADAEAEKIAARVGSGKGKLGMEAAGRAMEKIERPDEKVRTEVGSIGFRTVWEVVIEDVSRIDRKWMVVDMDAVKEALEAGVVVDGAKLVSKQVPINRR